MIVPKILLYASAAKPAYIEHALNADADAVVVDLEDSVPADEKDSARDVAVELLTAKGRSDRLWVRVNVPSSGELEEDLRQVLPHGAAGIRLPGIRTHDELDAVMAAVRGLSATPIRVELMIENQQALDGIHELLRDNPEIVALCHRRQ